MPSARVVGVGGIGLEGGAARGIIARIVRTRLVAARALVLEQRSFAENSALGLRIERVTDTGGRFFLAALPVGEYTLTVELGGFRRFTQRGLVLQVGQKLDVPIPVSETAYSMLTAAKQRGLGDLDVAAVLAFMEEISGLSEYPWPIGPDGKPIPGKPGGPPAGFGGGGPPGGPPKGRPPGGPPRD